MTLKRKVTKRLRSRRAHGLLRRSMALSGRQLVVFAVVFGLAGYIVYSTFANPNPSLQGDLNGDNSVSITDLSILLSKYGTTSTTADVNSDGSVNILDLSLLLSHYGTTLTAANVLNNPIDPNQIALTTFGQYSHWLQPWRAWMDTPTASQYLNRLGIGWNEDPQYYTGAAQAVAAAGIKRVRFEEGWNNVSWNEQSLSNAGNLDSELQAFKDNGLRPIILLNANSGAPGPQINWTANLTAAAAAGAQTVQVDSATAAQIVPNLSGFFGLTGYIANQVIFKSVSGTTVTLSKPLPIALSAGTHAADTLRYQPFYYPGTPEFEATLAGWLHYTNLVRLEANKILGPGGYDIEIWNELTFGSDFLCLGCYDPSYTSTRSDITSTDTRGEIARRTIRFLHSNGFQGAAIDGFTNTLPWISSARDEPGYTGASRHPYSTGTRSGPPWALPNTPLNALGQTATFDPSYTIREFPEYWLNLVQTEGYSRYLYPGPGQHLFSNPVGPQYDGQTWLTEIRSVDYASGPFPTYTVQKEILRLYAAWAGKGAYVFPYAVGNVGNWNLLGGPAGGSVVQVVGNYTATMPVGSITTPRQLQLTQIADNHNAMIFQGNGTAAYPNLYERDAVFVQPIQSSDHQFEVPAYVMTRDLTVDHPGRNFSLTMCCFSGSVTATATDPITNTSIPVSAAIGSAGKVTFSLSLIDYPRVITIHDGP